MGRADLPGLWIEGRTLRTGPIAKVHRHRMGIGSAGIREESARQREQDAFVCRRRSNARHHGCRIADTHLQRIAA